MSTWFAADDIPDELLLALPDGPSSHATPVHAPPTATSASAHTAQPDSRAAPASRPVYLNPTAPGAPDPPYTRNLNEPQRQAVLAPLRGALCVLAGAGSGKTSVMIARVQHILALGVPASRVLAVTFTRAAADEMGARLVRDIGPAAKPVTLSTFHALCLTICRRHADAAGYRLDFVVRTTKQQLKLVERQAPPARDFERDARSH